MLVRFLVVFSLLLGVVAANIAGAGQPVPFVVSLDNAAHADVIVDGVVKTVYSFDKDVGEGRYTHFVLAVEVTKVDKGLGAKPGDLLYLRGTVLKHGKGVKGYPTLSLRDGEDVLTPDQLNGRGARFHAARFADGGLTILFPFGIEVSPGKKM